ncbi:MAG: hypothetical protein GY946_23115 [bacterium]|nr:hypothetical protein [bacterium]
MVNDPGGTVTLPPAGCEYLADAQVYEITAGLPPGTTIELAPVHKDFICSAQALTPQCDIPAIPGVSCEASGGSFPGGSAHCFYSTLEFQVTGTGLLSGWSRTLSLGAATVVDAAPRVIGDPVQDFDTELVSLQSQLFGDPDFCVLSLREGIDQGVAASAGHTILTNMGGDNWAVDSFFDIHYEIDFQGCPGSVLEGFAGTSQGQIGMQAGEPQPQATPGLTGSWLFVFGSIMAGSAFYVLRRQQTT